MTFIIETMDANGTPHAYQIDANGTRVEIPYDDSITWDHPLVPSTPPPTIARALIRGSERQSVGGNLMDGYRSGVTPFETSVLIIMRYNPVDDEMTSQKMIAACSCGWCGTEVDRERVAQDQRRAHIRETHRRSK